MNELHAPDVSTKKPSMWITHRICTPRTYVHRTERKIVEPVACAHMSTEEHIINLTWFTPRLYICAGLKESHQDYLSAKEPYTSAQKPYLTHRWHDPRLEHACAVERVTYTLYVSERAILHPKRAILHPNSDDVTHAYNTNAIGYVTFTLHIRKRAILHSNTDDMIHA